MVFKFDNDLVFFLFNLKDLDLCLLKVLLNILKFFFEILDDSNHFLVGFLEFSFLVFLPFNRVSDLINLFYESEFALACLKVLLFLLLLVEWQMVFKIGKLFFKKLFSLYKAYLSSINFPGMLFHKFLNVLIVLELHLFFSR